jgi:hypothetical protein
MPTTVSPPEETSTMPIATLPTELPPLGPPPSDRERRRLRALRTGFIAAAVVLIGAVVALPSPAAERPTLEPATSTTTGKGTNGELPPERPTPPAGPRATTVDTVAPPATAAPIPPTTPAPQRPAAELAPIVDAPSAERAVEAEPIEEPVAEVPVVDAPVAPPVTAPLPPRADGQ